MEAGSIGFFSALNKIEYGKAAVMKNIVSIILIVSINLFFGDAITAETVYFEIEPNDSFQQAQFFFENDGDILLDNAGYQSTNLDYFAFIGTAGDIIDIHMDAIGGSESCDKDPLLRLINRNLELIEGDDDSGAGFNAFIEQETLSYTGIYYINADNFCTDVPEYNYELRINNLTAYFNECISDFNLDSDVDGNDLAQYSENNYGVSLINIAEQFGRSNCQ